MVKICFSPNKYHAKMIFDMDKRRDLTTKAP
jgi:hypothetical protein